MVIRLAWLYVFDSNETHEHISDLDNFCRFLEKIVQKSDFDDFSGKNVTVFDIKAHKAKFLFYFEGCLGIHKIYKDETDLGGVKDLTVNSIYVFEEDVTKHLGALHSFRQSKSFESSPVSVKSLNLRQSLMKIWKLPILNWERTTYFEREKLLSLS